MFLSSGTRTVPACSWDAACLRRVVSLYLILSFGERLFARSMCVFTRVGSASFTKKRQTSVYRKYKKLSFFPSFTLILNETQILPQTDIFSD